MENLILYLLTAVILYLVWQVKSLKDQVTELDSENERLRFYHTELDSENERLRFYHKVHPRLHKRVNLYKALAQEGVVYGLECAEALEAKVAQSLEWGKGYPHIEAAKRLESVPAAELRVWAKKVKKAVDQN